MGYFYSNSRKVLHPGFSVCSTFLCWIKGITCLAGLFVSVPAIAQNPSVSLEIKKETGRILVAASNRQAAETAFSNKTDRWENDSVLVTRDLKGFLARCRENAFLLASIDGITQSDSVIRGELFTGPKFEWLRFKPADATAERWVKASGNGIKIKPGSPVQANTLGLLQNRLLEAAENNGYPFAHIWLDSLQLDTFGATSALLRVEQGRYFQFNTLRINGEVKIPASTLSRYLGIRAGDPFSRAKVLRIKDDLRALPYLEPYNNPTINFAGDKATVNLWLKKKRAGRFDFIIGLLPQNENNSTAASRLLLTGSLNALLLNALGQGERLSVELERLKVETQRLDVQAAFPYIAGSPFGAEGKLYIFRRDSSWLDAQASIGAQYLLSGANRLVLTAENRSSSLQSVDTTAIINNRRLPANIDFKQNGLGLDLEWSDLNDRFNPRKGWYFLGRNFVGFHQFIRNSRITSLRDPSDVEYNFNSLYDSLPGRSVRLRLEGKSEVYLPVLQRSTILLRLRGGGLFSKAPVFQNEQYRLGGNKLLRGFDEESLFATRWWVGTLEYRLLIGQNSFMSVFADGGYIENTTARTRVIQHPLGVGAGMNFETPAGIFGISAAVGRRNPGDGLDFRAVKFHLGYVSLF